MLIFEPSLDFRPNFQERAKWRGDAIADIALTPYVNRLAMMSMRGMWEGGRLPNVEKWFSRIEAMPNFKGVFLDWVPEELTNDLRENGAKSWPEVAKILCIEI